MSQTDGVNGARSAPPEPNAPVLARFFIGASEHLVVARPVDLTSIANVARDDGHQPVYWFRVEVEDVSAISRQALGYRLPGIIDTPVPFEFRG